MKKNHNQLSYDLKHPRGVMKVKRGYNPNSSSIGTVVYAFPYAVIIIGFLAAIIGVLLGSRKKRNGGAW